MKKSHLGKIILSTVVIFSLIGCGSIQDKIAEKTSEKAASKAVGGNVDITKDGVKVQKDGVNYETGKDLKWPKESMGDIPEPKAKISAVLNANSSKGGSVVCSGMSLEDAKDYTEKLKSLGYKDGASVSETDVLSYSGKNSSEASVSFMYNISSKEGTIVYAYKDSE